MKKIQKITSYIFLAVAVALFVAFLVFMVIAVIEDFTAPGAGLKSAYTGVACVIAASQFATVGLVMID